MRAVTMPPPTPSPAQPWPMAPQQHDESLVLQLQADLAQARQALADAEASSLAKTQFLAAASHDLRQPLHALTLFAEALQSRPQDADQQRLVDNIRAAVDSLDSLFSALLDLTRIDAGAVQARPCTFQVEDLWRRLRVHFEPLAFDKGLALRLRGGHHLIHADPLLVERIVRNLVANAIRYTEDGGVLLAVRRRGDRLMLQVWDSGQGIAPADQQRVFGEFVQVAEATRSGEPGSRRGLGLGLAIVKRLTDLMGARIELKSTPGRGSVFTVHLPPGPNEEASEPAALAVPLSQTLHLRHIVVIEPDAGLRQELAALLASWGAEVTALDGAALRTTGTTCTTVAVGAGPAASRPHLVIVGLPVASGLDGDALLSALRAQFGAEVPMMWVGAPATAGAAIGSAVPGIHRLAKPLQPNRLRALIAFLLGGADGKSG